PTLPPSLLFLSHGLHLDLHSFPTRRSSDLHFHQGQADSVHRDGPLLHHPPRQPLGHADPKQDGIFMGDARLDDAGSIHVPLDKVAAEPIAGSQGPFQIDRGSDSQFPQIGPAHRLRHHVGGKGFAAETGHREAHPVDGDAVAGPNAFQHPAAVDLQFHRHAPAVHAPDAPHFLYDSCEHASDPRSSGYTGYPVMHTSSPNRSTDTSRRAIASAILPTPTPPTAEGASRPPAHLGATKATAFCTHRPSRRAAFNSPPPSARTERIPRLPRTSNTAPRSTRGPSPATITSTPRSRRRFS